MSDNTIRQGILELLERECSILILTIYGRLRNWRH